MATQKDKDGPFWDCRRSCDHLVYFTATECIEQICGDEKKQPWADWILGPASAMAACRKTCVKDARAAIPKCYEKCSEDFRGRKLKARYHNPQQANFQIREGFVDDDDDEGDKNKNNNNTTSTTTTATPSRK